MRNVRLSDNYIGHRQYRRPEPEGSIEKMKAFRNLLVMAIIAGVTTFFIGQIVLDQYSDNLFMVGQAMEQVQTK